MALRSLKRVVVTGLGAVSPLGQGAQRSWQNLLASHCGISALTKEDGDFSKNDSRIAGLVPRGTKDQGKWQASDWLSQDEERKLARFMQYGQVAADEALADAKWFPDDEHELDMTGVCIGSAIGAFEDIYNASLAFDLGGLKKVSPYFVPRLLTNLAAGHVSMRHGFRGPNHAAATACTTGAHSVGDAARFIQMGDANVMVAGGAESCIHPLAFTGFERSKSLTTTSNDQPEKASRPYSSNRDGFVIAEGAAVLVLEEMEHALKRNAHIYAEIAGYGTSADAYHVTQPPADGHGAFRAMRRAIQTAGLLPEQVDYVNAHATSTRLGDIAEANAIHRLFDSGKKRAGSQSTDMRQLVSSTKGATGHLLGAAGALEALFTVLSVKTDLVPPNLNLHEVDPQMPSLDFVPMKVQQAQVNVALSNSFGFGGTNATLCFRKYKAEQA